jgi:hypothetical protein
MSDIALVGHPARSEGEQPLASSRIARRPGDDRAVQERDFSRWRASLKQMESIRWDRVRDARSAIDAGEYLTSDRLDAAVDGLLRDLSDEQA